MMTQFRFMIMTSLTQLLGVEATADEGDQHFQANQTA